MRMVGGDIRDQIAGWPPVRNLIVCAGGFRNDVGEQHAASLLWWQFQTWIDRNPRTSTAALLVEWHYDAGDVADLAVMLRCERVYLVAYSYGGGEFYPALALALAASDRGIRLACLIDPVHRSLFKWRALTGSTLTISANTQRLWLVRQNTRGLRIKGSRPILADNRTAVLRSDVMRGVDHRRIALLPEVHEDVVRLVTYDISRCGRGSSLADRRIF